LQTLQNDLGHIPAYEFAEQCNLVATRDKSRSVPLPPIGGAIALIGGVALLVVGKNG
jgi:hypothetical protein